MNEANRPCPFCRSLISTEATKCRYCQSSLFSPGPTSADKIAELVVKSVGVVPILMALLLGVATIIGFKAMDDVQNSARRAESHASAIERDRHTISKLVVAEIDRHVDVLLNELTIDSSAPRAAEIREELKELLTALDREEESAIVQKSGKGPLLKALFAYYKGEYDDALKLVDQSRDDGRKYGIKGIILSHKADEAEQVKNAAAANEFRRQALQAFEYADRLAKREKRTLTANLYNLAGAYSKLGRFEEAEKILKDIREKEQDNELFYYNLASVYARWNKLEKALDVLREGVGKGHQREIIRRDLEKDVDFANLRNSNDPKIQERYTALLKTIPED